MLAGAKKVLIKYKPKIMLELAPHVYDSSPYKFDQLWQAYGLSDNRYKICQLGDLFLRIRLQFGRLSRRLVP